MCNNIVDIVGTCVIFGCGALTGAALVLVFGNYI